MQEFDVSENYNHNGKMELNGMCMELKTRNMPPSD